MTAEQFERIRQRYDVERSNRYDMALLILEVERLREGIEQKAAAAHYEWRVLGDADARDRYANLKELIYPTEESA